MIYAEQSSSLRQTSRQRDEKQKEENLCELETGHGCSRPEQMEYVKWSAIEFPLLEPKHQIFRERFVNECEIFFSLRYGNGTRIRGHTRGPNRVLFVCL